MLGAVVARLASIPIVRGGAFVVAAVALTLAVQAALHQDPAAPRFVGLGAAPPASQPATQAKVFGATLGAGAVADAATGATGSELVPFPASAFAQPIARYRVYARHVSARLAARVRALTAALRSGDRGRAEAAWGRADSAFQRVGAAYGALGGLGDRLDGGAGGLARGVRDPHWHGLQRIEYGLWSAHAAPRALVGVSGSLQADVRRLRRALGRSPITPLVYATRAHEILEDVQRDQLAGTPERRRRAGHGRRARGHERRAGHAGAAAARARGCPGAVAVLAAPAGRDARGHPPTATPATRRWAGCRGPSANASTGASARRSRRLRGIPGELETP